jgi:hypothetical protein
VLALLASAVLAGCAAREERRAALRLGADRVARAVLDSASAGRQARGAHPTWTAAGMSRDGRVAWWGAAFDANTGAGAMGDEPVRHASMILVREEGAWKPFEWREAPAPLRALGAPMPDLDRPETPASGGDSLEGKGAARIARQLRRDLGRLGRVRPPREAILVGPFAGQHAFGRAGHRELLGDLARDWSALQLHPDEVRVTRIPGTRSARVEARILGVWVGSGVSREVPLLLFALYQQSDEEWRPALFHLAREESAPPASARSRSR